MTGNNGFDNDKYLRAQTESIMERVNGHKKLYLEFGGKLLFDYHASRVLPGYDPNVKMRLLQQLSGDADVLLCIYAGDIERKKMRADFGITYDSDALKMIDDLREWGVDVLGVVITRYADQPAAEQFKNRLERRDVRVYVHRSTPGYPSDLDMVVSPRGYGANPYIETRKPLVVVTGPGPGSGKLATCLTLLYHDHQRGVDAGYAKFETFPIWDIPLKHPVNVAYEAATADIGDYNLVDPFHKDAYGKTVVNYNRDVEVFPILRRILERITGGSAVYRSPTDMGVNRASVGIIDDAQVRRSSEDEIIRRYFRYACEYVMGFTARSTVERVEELMKELALHTEQREVVAFARRAAEDAAKTGKGDMGIHCGAAIELHNGVMVTGKNSPLMHAASSLVLNAVKTLAGIPDEVHLLAPIIMASVGRLKRDVLNRKAVSLNLDETLVAISISATMNSDAEKAMDAMKELAGCEMHITHIPTSGDEAGLKRLGVNLTSDPNFSAKNLFFA